MATETIPRTSLELPAKVAPQTRKRARGVFRRWGKRALWSLIAVALAVAIALGLRTPPVPVEVALAQHGPMQVTVDEDGRTRVRERYVVAAPQTGRLLRV